MTFIFRSTNESLDAIVQSMQLTRKHNVLAVLGSGDQAFAMLEYAKLVVAIDNHHEQVKYAQKHKELISQGLFSRFLNRAEPIARKPFFRMQEYFKAPGRLEAIKKRINRLKILEGDIFRDSPGNQFSRIYLSNAISYLPLDESPEQNLMLIIDRLKPNGLLYVTDEKDMPSDPYSGIEEDIELTEIARDYQPNHWMPAVYRRIA
ncbi:MAG: class I SAM-dependent methyltransferase [Nanoarchaeota archaeon]